MFFADEAPQLFTSKLDMMKANPEWKLNVMNGAQIFFQVKADNGNEIYQKYIQTMKDSPNEVLYETVEEGVSKMKQRKNGIYLEGKGLWLYFKNNPAEKRPTIIPFESGRTHENLILTPNSPLFPYLSETAMEIYENGLLNILERKWFGEPIVPEPTSNLHTVVLGLGKTISIFLVLVISIVLSFVVMGLENLWHWINKFWIEIMEARSKSENNEITLDVNEPG